MELSYPFNIWIRINPQPFYSVATQSFSRDLVFTLKLFRWVLGTEGFVMLLHKVNPGERDHSWVGNRIFCACAQMLASFFKLATYAAYLHAPSEICWLIFWSHFWTNHAFLFKLLKLNNTQTNLLSGFLWCISRHYSCLFMSADWVWPVCQRPLRDSLLS